MQHTRCGAIRNEGEYVDEKRTLGVDNTASEHVQNVHHTPCRETIVHFYNADVR